MIAAGTYLKILREHAGITQDKLARLTNTTTNTIWRIESGKQEPRAIQFSKILAAICGDPADVALLSDSDELGAADGEALALKRIAAVATDRSELLEGLTREQQQLLLEIARQMKR